MVRISNALALDDQGLPCVPPVVTPRPIDGLVTKRVLVMDYLPGVPLSRCTCTCTRVHMDYLPGVPLSRCTCTCTYVHMHACIEASPLQVCYSRQWLSCRFGIHLRQWLSCRLGVA